MENNTDTGDTCPITLDRIQPQNVFVHGGVPFDVFALYTYLTKSVVFVNPVNRVPFVLTDLEALEEKIKSICGEDAVSQISQFEMSSESTTPTRTDVCETLHDSIDSSTSNVSVQLLLVPSTPDDDKIRLEVNLNVSTPRTSESGGSLEDFEEDSDVKREDLPPSQCFPSLVELFHDKHRTTRMKADLDLLQYLSYDSADVLAQILSLLSDDHFHQMIWEQTYPTVLDAISRLVGERDEVDVEITYSDCWDTYRTRVLRVLNRRYAEVVQDIKNIDADEAELCVTSHIAVVEQNKTVSDERKSWILQALREILRSL